MVGVGARGSTALQLKKSMGLLNYASENENSDSVIGSLIQSIKVGPGHNTYCTYFIKTGYGISSKMNNLLSG
jgi:hypothetical protein